MEPAFLEEGGKVVCFFFAFFGGGVMAFYKKSHMGELAGIQQKNGTKAAFLMDNKTRCG
jgi:hypothetical protein